MAGPPVAPPSLHRSAAGCRLPGLPSARVRTARSRRAEREYSILACWSFTVPSSPAPLGHRPYPCTLLRPVPPAA
jgi:hypothetical protein